MSNINYHISSLYWLLTDDLEFRNAFQAARRNTPPGCTVRVIKGNNAAGKEVKAFVYMPEIWDSGDAFWAVLTGDPTKATVDPTKAMVEQPPFGAEVMRAVFRSLRSPIMEQQKGFQKLVRSVLDQVFGEKKRKDLETAVANMTDGETFYGGICDWILHPLNPLPVVQERQMQINDLVREYHGDPPTLLRKASEVMHPETGAT